MLSYSGVFRSSLDLKILLILTVNMDRASCGCGIWEFLPKKETEMTLATICVNGQN